MEIEKIISILNKKYPKSFSGREDPFKVLITTVLSQRTKDENTERASKMLFKNYKNAKQLAKADIKNIQKLIRATGFYRQKAKNIKRIAKIIIEKYEGRVPNNMKELLSLPGVGRKTANCVLVYAYKIPAIPVDVHVHTIANRLGIVETKIPEQTEAELIKKIDKKYWIRLNELFVRFGKEICRSKPRCEICDLKKYCEFYKKIS